MNNAFENPADRQPLYGFYEPPSTPARWVASLRRLIGRPVAETPTPGLTSKEDIDTAFARLSNDQERTVTVVNDTEQPSVEIVDGDERFNTGMQELLAEKRQPETAGVATPHRYSTRRPSIRARRYSTGMETGTKVQLSLYLAALGLALLSPQIVDANFGTERAEQVAEHQGFTNVTYESTSKYLGTWKGCNKAQIAYEFVATVNDGKRVGVVVCKGMFGAASVKING